MSANQESPAPVSAAALGGSGTPATTLAGSRLSSTMHPSDGRTPGPPPQIPDYQLVRHIGTGSYGDVWLARSVMGSFRAVKVVYRDRFDNDRPYDREFEGIRKFEPISRAHASQVDILHIGRNDAEGYFYYVMELADDASEHSGSGLRPLPDAEVPAAASERVLPNPLTYIPLTLRLELQRRRRLPFQECLQLGLSLATALEHLHGHGLIHRDIKPSNIIFVNGLPKLADIGLVTESGKTMSFVGTAGYLPPEGPGTVQGDLYSLGKVLYEACTGKDRQEFPELPTALDALTEEECLLEFNEILVRACHQDARQRYGSASELREDLELLRRGKSLWRIRLLERRLNFTKRAFAAVGVITALVTAAYVFQRRHVREVETKMYTANMNLAQRDADQANLERLSQLLDETYASPQKGFEWFYWQRQLHLDLKTFRGHMDAVEAVAFSPDGERIVTGSWDQTARVWDLGTGRQLLLLQGHRSRVTSVGFSPDGRRIVTGSWDGTARLWEAATGTPAVDLEGHTGMVLGTAISPDGQLIATVSRYTDAALSVQVGLWDARSGRKLRVFGDNTSGLGPVAFSPDGKLLSAGADRFTVKIWDTASGQERFVCRSKGEFCSLAFSPDGQRLVTASSSEAAVWDVSSSEQWLLLQSGSDPGVASVAYSADGKRIAGAARDQRVIVWDAATGQEQFRLAGHRAAIRAVAFSSDGCRIATVSLDGTAKLWDAAEPRNPRTFPNRTAAVHMLVFSPDGLRVAAGTWDKSVRIWEVATGRELHGLTGELGEVTHLAFSPDGMKIATGNGWNAPFSQTQAKIWDCASGRELLALDGNGFVTFSPDGRRIATASGAGTATIWNAVTGAGLVTLRGHADWVQCGAFSPDGKRIATACGDRTASSSGARTIKLWDAGSGRELFTIKRYKPENPNSSSLAFSPDGNRIAFANNDRTPRVWDANTGRELLALKGHKSMVPCIAFSPDGKRILTSSADRAVKIWDAFTGRELLTLEGHTRPVTAAAFSPDGKRIATGGNDGLIKIWDTASPEQVLAWREEERLAPLRPE